jgi:secreted PhoX family phosphatase
MDHDDGISNTSGNRPFEDVLQASASRRTILAGGAAAAATGFFGSSFALAGANDDSGKSYRPRSKRGLIGFAPVPSAVAVGPDPVISDDYQYEVLIPWGEPIDPDGPAFSYPPSPEDQAEQIGIGHDGMWFFPYTKKDRQGRQFQSNRHGMLAINHEFGTNPHVLGKALPESLEDVRVSQHAHGVSVVAIARWKSQWRVVRSKNSRRIHVNTPVAFSGPVAGHPLLDTPNGNIPLGTVNNCANGYTPWGTYLTCEENFNGYFGASNREQTWAATAEQSRYGFSDSGFGYGWHLFDRRFDLSDPDYRNEENRFGWIVEIDPFDATQKPVKRTALGRFKHEGIALAEGRDGRVVGYMGDDERFDYIYKFVSDDNWQSMRARGQSPLDHGTLYAAKFNDDGSGEWLPLTMDDPRLAARFADQAELLVYARIAADLVGATPMDRPEWTSVAPNGDVYCTLTNNTRRTAPGPANPLAPNPWGHIIRWRDSDQHVGTTFKWEIFLIAEATIGTEDAFGSPDGLWADPYGRVFIQTDGSQPGGLNDQMLVADAVTGELRRMFSGVAGSEVTGIAVTPDQRTMFINLQHPGDGDPAVSTFPVPFDGVTIPRDATLVITRKDGGVIGS